MTEVIAIGLDIAKNVFQAYGADAAGRQVFSQRLARGKVLDFSPGNQSASWHWRLVAGRITGPVN